MIDTETPPERAYLVALDLPSAPFAAADSLEELASLVEAAGGIVTGRVVQNRRTPDRNSWVGKGKAEEIGREVARLRADIVVADDELSPAQQRTLEETTNVPVVDRSGVILDIFARHARSREGRIQDLKERLAEVARQRERARGSRAGEGLFLASLAGYTNAGKSTLLNALANADVFVADQPFATLDPTTRRTALPGGVTILLSDTVGFVNKLPPTLVAAFRATLEELADADLLVHVAEAGHPNLHEHLRVVGETLGGLGLGERPRLLVLNKVDLLKGTEGAALRQSLAAEFPAAVFVSATSGQGLDDLRARLAEAAAARWRRVRTTLPYHAGALVQRIRTRGALRRADYDETGIRIEADVPPDLAAEIETYIRTS
ncbi:MAG: GTPase HflX [Chloroflexi bacterium]|nr:MAG: GTPase HflX [Chloroflexota bacterium]